MKTTNLFQPKFIVTIFLAFFILGGQPIEFGLEKTFFHGYLIKKPIIKIGLGLNLSDIKISSSSGMKIYEVNSWYKLIADEATQVRIKGHKEKLSEKFLIQIAQTKDKKEAEAIAQELKTKIRNKIYITENEEDNVTIGYQVKIGDFLTRGEALSFIKKLEELGFKESWILREDITFDETRPLWILVNDELKRLKKETVLYFIPSNGQSFLSFNGRNYRGIFVLKPSSKGLVLINILNLEDYLKGVVPSELSPYEFNELEALKAQAVAARTYAIKKLGMYNELGFDLSDTPNSQFYKGMGAEHPLSTKAVEMTRGQVALYKGKLIDALYTSTCGGMTEDVENVFGGQPLPYLRSTECVYEKQNVWLIKGKNLLPPILVEGKNISPIVASLLCLQIIPFQEDSSFFQEEASYEEAVQWLQKIINLLGKKIEQPWPQASVLNYGSLASLIVKSLGWEKRVQTLLLKSEKDFILQDYEQWPEGLRDYLAYLIQSGIFPATLKMKNPENSLTRSELAFYLGKVVQSYRDLTHSGIFRKLEGKTVELEEEKEIKNLGLSPDLVLLKNNSGHYVFTTQLRLLKGDRVRWIEGEGQIKLLEAVYSFHSNILDRDSIFHNWQIKKSREELERRINQFYPVGQLQDLIPQKRGHSNRVVELLVKGSDSQVLIKGFKIRRVLGLKDTLFVIDREYDKHGQISSFIFYGKGWGHGVGLCQVGAFGMAREGADYKEILKKYYHGIKIAKIY